MKAKKILVGLFAMIMSMLPIAVQSQNVIYEVLNYPVENSIIRASPGKDAYVIYTDDGVNQKFVYFEPQGSYVRVADFTTAKVQVNDMEIVDDLLFFCGSSLSGTGAVFGYFEIPSVFFSSGDFYVNYTSDYFFPNGQTREFLTSYYRLEVQKITSTDIHIYMIADAYNVTGSTVSNNYRCIVDVWEQGLMAGQANTQEEFYGDYHFNDLAVTDRELVVVGDKHGGTGQYMHSYPLPLPMTPTIFPSTSITYNYALDFQYYPYPEVQIEHIDNSYFAVACRGVIQSTQKSITVTTYNGMGGLIDRIQIHDPYNTTQIRDLRYNPITHKLSLLPDWKYAGQTNSHYVIDLSPTYTMTGVTLVTPNVDVLHSLETSQSYQAMLSGQSSGILQMWWSDIAQDQCASSDTVPFIHHFFPEPSYIMDLDVNQWTYFYRQITPVVTIENIDLICKPREE